MSTELHPEGTKVRFKHGHPHFGCEGTATATVMRTGLGARLQKVQLTNCKHSVGSCFAKPRDLTPVSS